MGEWKEGWLAGPGGRRPKEPAAARFLVHVRICLVMDTHGPSPVAVGLLSAPLGM